jgi:hypothetical protein
MVTKHPRKLPRLGKGEDMRHMFGKLVAAGTITAVLVLTPAIASAGTSTGQEFGQHVRTCAQTMGFNGTHNPGMHQGFAGWNSAETC